MENVHSMVSFSHFSGFFSNFFFFALNFFFLFYLFRVYVCQSEPSFSYIGVMSPENLQQPLGLWFIKR